MDHNGRYKDQVQDGRYERTAAWLPMRHQRQKQAHPIVKLVASPLYQLTSICIHSKVIAEIRCSLKRDIHKTESGGSKQGRKSARKQRSALRQRKTGNAQDTSTGHQREPGTEETLGQKGIQESYRLKSVREDWARQTSRLPRGRVLVGE